MNGPDQNPKEDAPWTDFRDYTNCKEGESPFKYRDETPFSEGKIQAFSDLNNVEPPEKI